jgi:DNA-binding transcriptional LysR family regulator
LRDVAAKLHMNQTLDWNDLRYFLAVARNGSTIAAAKELGVNQSTVQRRLAVLEEAVGRKLVERLPSGYRLTGFGEELRPHAEAVEAAVANLDRKIASADTAPTGVVRLTCAEGMAYRFIPRMLDAFHARYPAVRVDLIIGDRYLDLAKGEADIALRAGESKDSTLISRKIANAPWALYVSHSYAERNGRPEQAADLDQHAIMLFDEELERLPASRWLRAAAPNATVTARCNGVIGMLLAVKSGVGIGPLPVQIGDMEEDLVRLFDPVPESMSSIYLLVHPDLRNAPRVRALFDFMVAEIDTFRPLLGDRR